MLCKNCGIMLKDGAKFCPSCGSPVEAADAAPAQPAESTVKCPSCGTDVKQGAKFCPGCGYNMNNPAPAAEQDVPSVEQPAPATVVPLANLRKAEINVRHVEWNSNRVQNSVRAADIRWGILLYLQQSRKYRVLNRLHLL